MKTNFFLLLTFLLSSLAFSDGTWNGGISVNKDKVVVGGSVTATVSATYQPDDPDIQQEIEEGEADYEYEWETSGQIPPGEETNDTTCTVQFPSPSSSVDEDYIKCTVKLVYKDENGNTTIIDSITYTANLTVFAINLNSDKNVICAGGSTTPDLDICKTKITASTTPTLSGITVNFQIAGNKGVDTIEGETYYNVGTQQGNLTASSGITDSSGEASVYLISSEDASSPETQLYYYEAVECLYDGVEIESVWVRYDPPQYNLEIFLDPETEQPLEYLIADGESQAMNKLKVEYNTTPLPNHTINWKFRFWKYETVDNAAQNKYGVHFEELSASQQEEIFNTTPPDYEGTDSSIYGTLTSSSTTDTDGIATSIYTAGTEAGFIEFWWEERSVKKAKRGSFFLLWPFGKDRWGKEKLKLRVWLDPGGEFPYPQSTKTILSTQCFGFLGNRFEFINEQIQPRLANDRYIYNEWREGMTWAETGAYDSYHPYKIYVCLEKIRQFYEQGMYGEQEAYYDTRAAYTIAHEIEHTYQPIWAGSGHHDNCIMIPNITALPANQNWQNFCNTCIRRILNKLGD